MEYITHEIPLTWRGRVGQIGFQKRMGLVMKLNCFAVVTFAIGATSIGGNVALAQSLQEDAIVACLNISDDDKRLACFENAANQLLQSRQQRTATAAQPTDTQNTSALKPKSVPSTVVATQTETPGNFGAEDIASERKKFAASQLKSIVGKSTKVKTNKLGKVTITLDNGQVWRQQSSDNRRIRLKDDGTPYSIEIKRTSFGGYMLKVNDSKRTIRVKRIK